MPLVLFFVHYILVPLLQHAEKELFVVYLLHADDVSFILVYVLAQQRFSVAPFKNFGVHCWERIWGGLDVGQHVPLQQAEARGTD